MNTITENEKFDLLLNQFKDASVSDCDKVFVSIYDKFRFLTKEDKTIFSENLFNWAAAVKSSQPVKFAYAEFLIALKHFTAEENESALKILVRTRQAFDELNNEEGLALCATLFGAIYRTFGNFELALKILWEAFSLHKKSGLNPIAISAVANSIANIDFEYQNFQESAQMFGVAYEESIKANDFYFKIYALHGLGKVRLSQQKFDDAKEFFEEALELARQNNHPMHIANSLTELTKLYVHLKNYSEGERLCIQSLQIRENNNFKGGVVTSYILLAEIKMLQLRYDEAWNVLQSGLAIAEKIKVKPKVATIHHLLSQIKGYLKDYEGSLFHYRQFHITREEVEKEDNARKISDAKLVFEAEQTRKENVVIKKQKEEIEKKNTELQNTIDELTRTKISRKAKVWTLALIIVLFIFQDWILGTALRWLHSDNYFLLLAVKMGIIFSLSPINKAIEKYLLSKVVKEKEED